MWNSWRTYRQLVIGKNIIADLDIIADDMGSIELDNGQPIGYGSEIGAFLRLDDLQPGYGFGQVDRAIIMSASQENARIVIPLNSFNSIIKGYEITCPEKVAKELLKIITL